MIGYYCMLWLTLDQAINCNQPYRILIQALLAPSLGEACVIRCWSVYHVVYRHVFKQAAVNSHANPAKLPGSCYLYAYCLINSRIIRQTESSVKKVTAMNRCGVLKTLHDGLIRWKPATQRDKSMTTIQSRKLATSVNGLFVVMLVGFFSACTGSDSGFGGQDPVKAASQNVEFSWVAPSKRTDGSSLNDLAGYHLRIGNKPGAYTQTINLEPNVTSHTLTDLSPGTYYFAITAYDSNNVESESAAELTAVLK